MRHATLLTEQDSIMASGATSSRLYEADDDLDDSLLNKVSKWILFNRMDIVAIHLGFTAAEYSRIRYDGKKSPEQRIFGLLKTWDNSKIVTVRDMVKQMVQWNKTRCLDPHVWQMLQTKVHPSLMPHPDDIKLPIPLKMECENTELPSLPESGERKSRIEEVVDTEHTPVDVESSISSQSPTDNSEGNVPDLSDEGIADFQDRLKQSLDWTWKNSLSHDWIQRGQSMTFSLKEFYVGLSWFSHVKGAIENIKKDLGTIFGIFDIEILKNGAQAQKILLTAGPGMGKTSSMAKLALEWYPGCFENENPLNRFDFVFLMRLQQVAATSSMAQVIINQHGKLRPIDTQFINLLLEGCPKYKILLILDGYNEYVPGTNKEIDAAIANPVANRFLIVMSRPDFTSSDGRCIGIDVNEKMDVEVTIEGFNEESITQCVTNFLDDKCDDMMKHAKQTGIYSLLTIPAVLLMVCVEYSKNVSIFRSKTAVYEKIIEQIIERTALKLFSPELYADVKGFLDVLLVALGELSWASLQKNEQQFLLKREDVDSRSPILMKLGLLVDTRNDVIAVKERPYYVTFQDPSLHQFASSKFLSSKFQGATDTEATLKAFLPSFDNVLRHVNAIVSTCGQMSCPTHLMDHIFEECIRRCLHVLRTIQSEKSVLKVLENLWKEIEETRLLQLLYTESRVPLPGEPLHNQYINIYTPPDICPLFLPSRFYAFFHTRKYFQHNCSNSETKADNPDCAIVIHSPDPQITKWLLSTCHKITRYQQITDLLLRKVKCEDFTEHDLFNISENAQCVSIQKCALPQKVLKHLMHQLSKCRELQYLTVTDTIVSEAGLSLAKSIKSWRHQNKLEHFLLCKCSAPERVLGELLRSLSVCISLTSIDLIGEAGYQLSKTLQSWSRQPTLQRFMLNDCSMSKFTWNEVLKALLPHENLIELDLSDNNLKDAGSRLIELIKSWGRQPSLQLLNLKNCEMPANVCCEFLAVVSRCFGLKYLNMSCNAITDALSNFVTNPHPGLLELETLELSHTQLSRDDLRHLKLPMQNKMLPRLESLCLQGTFECAIGKELGELIETCVNHHQRGLRIELGYIPYEDLKSKWMKCSKGSKVILKFDEFDKDDLDWLLGDFDLD